MKAFLDNFDLVALSIDGPQRIRRLILDFAVRGWLVRQDPSDEPGEALLRRAAKERQELIDAGVVPRPTKLAPGRSSNEAFGVPAGWTWGRMEDIASYVQRGKGPEYVTKSLIPVVSQKCVQWSGFDVSRARFIQESSVSKYGRERFLRDGDILWNSTGTGTVGRVAVYSAPQEYPQVVADSHVTVIRPLVFEPSFLYFWLASTHVQQTIEDLTSGTTKQQELNTSTVRRHAVPAPPLAEQKRIVAQVSELMSYCEELERSILSRDEARTRLAAAIEYEATRV